MRRNAFSAAGAAAAASARRRQSGRVNPRTRPPAAVSRKPLRDKLMSEPYCFRGALALAHRASWRGGLSRIWTRWVSARAGPNGNHATSVAARSSPMKRRLGLILYSIAMLAAGCAGDGDPMTGVESEALSGGSLRIQAGQKLSVLG